MSYTKQELENMPMSILRGIDIKSQEEEEMIQKVVNQKLADMPLDIDLNINSSRTDDMTPEKEALLQAEIDAKKAAARKELLPEVSQETAEVIQNISVPSEFKIEGVETVKKPFCQFCASKGVRHLKTCTRNMV